MTGVPEIVAAAIRLAPAVRAARDDAERQRQTPPELADAITKAGIYQMYLPRSMGGPETPPLTAFRVVEELSKVDGSVGWCAMIATSLSLNAARLPAEVGRELAGTPADYRGAGSARVGGNAWPASGGFRVKGRWNFASGIQNANWLYCTCIEMNGDAPRLTAAGAPATARAVGAPGRGDDVDTWSVMGMRGTGSQDFTVDDVFVPARRSCLSDAPPCETGPLHPRAWYVHIWTPSAANALGIARGAIDSLAEIAQTEASTLATSLLRDRPMVQARDRRGRGHRQRRPRLRVRCRRPTLEHVMRRRRRLGPPDRQWAAGAGARDARSGPSGRQSVSCGRDQRDLHKIAVGTGVSRRPRRGPTRRRVAGLFRVRGQGAAGIAPRRSGLVIHPAIRGNT